MSLDNTHIKPPFTVPQGYFEDMEGRIMSEVKISGMSKFRDSLVSETYFDHLEDQVLSSLTLQKFSLKSDYSVPQGYFEDMEDQILNRVNIEDLNQPKVNQAYFDELEGNVLAAVKIEQMGRLKINDVPEGYFDILEEEILSKTSEKRKAGFTLFRNLRVFRAAAAVLLLGVLGYGASLFKTEPKDDELADISTTALISYLNDQAIMEEDLEFILEGQDDYTLLTSDISDSDISAYLTENGI